MSVFFDQPLNKIGTDAGDLFLAPVNNVVLSGATNLVFSATNGVGVQFWGSTSFTIYMSATNASGVISPRLDATSDYNMYFRMNSGTNRGFVFLNGSVATFQIEGNGNAQLVGALTVGAGATANGLIALSGSTTNLLNFGTPGVAVPTFTTRSAGTKIVLYQSLSGSAADYALGIEGNHLWFSTQANSASFGFKWYGGTTNVATLNGLGQLTLSRSLTVSSSADGQALLTFASERSWTVFQRGSGSNTVLSFENTTDKNIQFTSGTAGAANIVISPTDANPYVRIGSSTLTGNTTSNDFVASTPMGGSAPLADYHFTTRAYIDDLSFKNSVRCATTGFVGTALEGSAALNPNEIRGMEPNVSIAGCTTVAGSNTVTVPGSGNLLPIYRFRIGSLVTSSGSQISGALQVTAISGNTVTLSGTAAQSGSGNVTLLISNTIAALNIDGVALSVGNRVLVKDHPTLYANGVYTVGLVGSTTVAWKMIRATDADTWAGVVGAYLPVEAGTINAESFWISTNDQGGTLNSTAITYSCVGSKMLGLTVAPAFALALKGTTSNWIDFGTIGLGSPTFTTRSAGTKIAFRTSLTSTLVDYAMGVDTAILWSSIPQASVNYAFRWYAGTTNIMSLTGDATLTINSTSQDNIVLASTSAAGNTIQWAAAGAALPTFNTRSAGTKLVLYPSVAAAAADYAIGIANNVLWQSISAAVSTRYFAWYGGTSKVMDLSGDSTLTVYSAGGGLPMIRVSDLGNGYGSISNGMGGFELTAALLNNSTNLYTPAIKFGTTDPDVSTTNPKFSAFIVGEGTEVYNNDNAGGMALSFFGSANAPGAAPAAGSYTRMLRLATGGATFSGSGAFSGVVSGSDPTATNHFMTLGYWEDKSAKDSVRLASTAWQNTFLEASWSNGTVLTGPAASYPVSACSTANGQAVITVPGSGTAQPIYRIEIGATVTGTGIPAGTTVLTISGNTLTISNNATNTSNGGVTLTFANSIAALNIDGVTASVGNRVLIKNHVGTSANGLYVVTAIGSASVPWSMARSSDTDTWAALPGALVAVEEGAINSESVWECTSNQGGTLGSSSITWQIIAHKYLLPAVAHNAVAATIDYTLTLGAGTSNTILWGSAGSDYPTTGTRSAGAKLVLRTGLSSTAADYALGIGPSTLWLGTPSTSQGISFYGGTTEIARFVGAGYLVIDNGADNFSAPPTTNTRSAGTRLVLDQTLSSTDMDAAIGVDEVNGQWYSVPKGTSNSGGFSWFWGGNTTGPAALLSFTSTVAKLWIGSNFSGTSEIDLGSQAYISATSTLMTLSADGSAVTGLQFDRTAKTVAVKVDGTNVGFYNAQGGRGGFSLLRRVIVMGGNVTTENIFAGTADTVVAGSTWNRQSDEKLYHIVAVGGGGGGGGGSRGDATATRFGGGGGAGGSVTKEWVHAFQFTNTAVACTIGAGGTAGTAAATSGANGGNGGAGGVTELTVAVGYIIRAIGGIAGVGGTATAGTAGGQGSFAAGYPVANIAGGAGAAGAGNASNGIGFGAGGGGGGAGLAVTTQAATTGGNGTQGNNARAGASMGVSGTGGTAGNNGNNGGTVDPALFGRGGGGGGSAVSTVAGAGGNGSLPGGGAGGGGSAGASATAGAGGTGGGGGFIIYCYG